MKICGLLEDNMNFCLKLKGRNFVGVSVSWSNEVSFTLMAFVAIKQF